MTTTRLSQSKPSKHNHNHMLAPKLARERGKRSPKSTTPKPKQFGLVVFGVIFPTIPSPTIDNMSMHTGSGERYNSGLQEGRPIRTAAQLRCRWQRVMPKLQLFAGYYANIQASRPSGNNSEDIYDKAADEYKILTGHAFDFKKLWKMLKNTPKF